MKRSIKNYWKNLEMNDFLFYNLFFIKNKNNYKNKYFY